MLILQVSERLFNYLLNNKLIFLLTGPHRPDCLSRVKWSMRYFPKFGSKLNKIIVFPKTILLSKVKTKKNLSPSLKIKSCFI